MFFVGSAYAGTYFVDANGNNSTGDGSQNKPWKTIAYALKEVSSGDTISINNGTYTEGQLVVPPGVSLTSTAKNNTKVKLQPNTDFGTNRPFILLSSNPGGIGNQSISHLEINGKNGSHVARIGIGVQSRDNVKITNNNIHDFYGACYAAAVEVMSTQPYSASGWWSLWPSDPGPKGDDSSIIALWPANPVQNFELAYNTIKDCGWYGSNRTGSVGLWHLKNGKIHHNKFAMPVSRGQAITGRGYGGAHGKTALLNNVDIYENQITMGEEYPDKDNFMIEMWVMRGGCQIYNNSGTGWYSLTVGKDTSVYNNTISMVNPAVQKGIGIEFNMQSYGKISNNYIENSKWGIIVGFSYMGGNWTTSNVTVNNNVIYNNKYQSIWVSCLGAKEQGSYATVKNINISGNFLVGDSDRGTYGITVSENPYASECSLSNVDISENKITSMNNAAGKTAGSVANISVTKNNFYNNYSNSWIGSNDTGTITSDPGLPIPPRKPAVVSSGDEGFATALEPPSLSIVD